MGTSERISLAGVVVTLLVGFMTAAFNGALNDVAKNNEFLKKHLKLGQADNLGPSASVPSHSAEHQQGKADDNGRLRSVPRATPPLIAAGNSTIAATSQRTAVPETLVMDYEALLGRFSAVEASLRQRIIDLAGAPPKPEILAELTTCRQDLAKTKTAIDAADKATTKLRLQRVRKALEYLESL
jgi:hypothetical protein